MENVFNSGGPCIESALSICCIVGRDWGLTHKHANAIFTATTTSSSLTSSIGGKGRLSITSFNSQWSVITGNEVEDEEDADDNSDEMSSPGCLPIITSIVTTPKL